MEIDDSTFLSPVKFIRGFFKSKFSESSTVTLFMQHLDSTLSLSRGGAYGVQTKLESGPAPSAFIPQAIDVVKKLGQIISSDPYVMNLETLQGIPSTAHILGGACMGENDQQGVINKDNKVFNYENLFIFDGSMISANPGVNPSLSITAITEFGMSKFPRKSV